jgi:hypothetical protein
MTETVHACPPRNTGLTLCCGRSPFELPDTDRLTLNLADVTCAETVRPPVKDVPHDNT